jgi:hypothetical protein
MAKIETRFVRMPACSARADDHVYCAGSYIARERDIIAPAAGPTIQESPIKGPEYEVRYVCNCPGHRTGRCGSAQRDLFRQNEPEPTKPHKPIQGKLFG